MRHVKVNIRVRVGFVRSAILSLFGVIIMHLGQSELHRWFPMYSRASGFRWMLEYKRLVTH